MRAWQVAELGEPAEVLKLVDVPEPQPGPGEVLIRVAAVACNFPDILLCQGRYQERPPLPFTPGMELAGEVVAVGEGVPESRVGERVIAQPGAAGGGYAEYAVAPAANLWAWPDGMTPAQAAGMFVTYQTGYCALHQRANIQPGETLLVHAAAGGVGSAAVQLGKAAGATVIGTAGGERKCAVARDLGADHVIDYSTEDLIGRVKEITGGRGADVIYDPVGGDVFDASRKVIAFEGRILVIGFAAGRIAQAPTNHALVKNYGVLGVHWGYYRQMAPELIPQWQDALVELWRQRKIDPLVGGEYPLDRAPDALRALAGRETVGKVVLVP